MRSLLLVPLLFVGCTTTYVHRADSQQSTTSWHAAPDSQRTDEPVAMVPRRDPAPAARSKDALTREQVLDLANKGGDVGDAIAEIDRHPLGFPLSKENLSWFEERVAPPELLDYLRKRSAIDWDALAQAPLPAPQAAPEPPAAAPDSYPTPNPDAQPPRTTVYVEETPPPTVIYEYGDPYYYGPVWVGGVWVYGPRYYGRGGHYTYGGYRYGTYRGVGVTVGPAGATAVAPAAGLYVTPSVRTSTRAWSTTRGASHGGHR
ncbi:MAG TPA: hypothetical protein VFF73_32075 [Planctomycetota bacterium]|nr:hypothetical protein [Planctomycetota bacterium]